MQIRNLKLSILAFSIALAGVGAFAASGSKPGNEEDKPAPKVTANSAKTVRELVAIDDKLALTKAQNELLVELVKAREIDPGIKRTEDNTKALRFERDNIAADKKNSEIAASNIVITSIMGMEGSRFVEGTIGQKPFHFTEGKVSNTGWTLISIRDQCATFEQTHPVGSSTKATKSKNSKGDTKKTKVMVGEKKTACFTQISQQPRTYGPTGTRIPIPLPIPRQSVPMPARL